MTLLDKFLSRKGLYASFWFIGTFMVAILIYFTANLVKEVPPIAKTVTSQSGEVLYTFDDVAQGKGYFQQFDLMDYGTMLGMGAYMGPDFSTEFMHKRAEFLYDYFAKQKFGKSSSDLSKTELAVVKAMTIIDFKEKTTLSEEGTIYTTASALAYKANVAYLVDFLVNGEIIFVIMTKASDDHTEMKVSILVDGNTRMSESTNDPEGEIRMSYSLGAEGDVLDEDEGEGGGCVSVLSGSILLILAGFLVVARIRK